MIFHHPLPIDYNSKVASGIRPVKMIHAFEELGYQVFLVTGSSSERRLKIKELKKNIEKGEQYDFLYSESSTLPTLLTNDNRVPISPFLDFDFFKYLKSKNIRIGLFYRDIYWRFTADLKIVSKVKYLISKLFFKYDLWWYQKTIDKLYLPSLKMSQYIEKEISSEKISDLPPGCLDKKFSKEIAKHNNDLLNILYIGGLSSHYEMHTLFEVVSGLEGVSLTVCTRESEWENSKPEYEEYISDNIKVVHKFGSDLDSLYKECDIASLFVKGGEYRSFAAPVKLYEYMGNNKPVIAVKNTLAGEFVEENDIGWCIPYTSECLKELLCYIKENKEVVSDKSLNCSIVSYGNTWKERAKKVQSDLLNG